MTFVVGQGVISLLGRCREWKVSEQGEISILGRCTGWKVSGQGLISPRQMQPAWSIRVEQKFCFVFSKVR